MIMRGWWHRSHQILTWAQAFLGFLAGAVGMMLKADAAKWEFWPPVPEIIKIAQGNAFWVVPAATGICGLLQWLKRKLGSPFYVWEIIRFILNDLRESIFDGDPNAGHHERVTLFRFHKFSPSTKHWPWTDWLVPVERSGTITRKSKARFRATDDGDGCEGVVGQAWANNRVIYVSNLPEITNQTRESAIKNYAKQTFCSPEAVKNKIHGNRPLPRSLCAIPVEVKNEVWGVIVIDSRNPNLIDEQQVLSFFQKNAKILSKLLEKL